MKVRVILPFFDDNGLHRVGDIVDVDNFSDDRMEIVEEAPKKAPEEAPKKKTTTKK